MIPENSKAMELELATPDGAQDGKLENKGGYSWIDCEDSVVHSPAAGSLILFVLREIEIKNTGESVKITIELTVTEKVVKPPHPNPQELLLAATKDKV